MKKILISIIIFLSAVTAIYATPQNPTRKLERLVERAEKRHTTYTEEDWVKIAEEYDKLKKEFKKYEYTNEELKETGKFKGRLKGYIAKKKIKNFGETLEEFANEMEGDIEGFIESLKKEE